MEEVPEVCGEGQHTTDQTGKCTECGVYPNQTETARFSGGAGARTHPLSDEDYRREMRKLERLAGE